MSVHDALGQNKAGKSPCVGMGSEEVVVDLLAPLAAPLEIVEAATAIPPPPVFGGTRADRRRRVLYLAGIGRTTAEIAAEVGLARGTVRDMLAAAYIRAARAAQPKREGKRRVCANGRAEIARRIAAGESSTAVARDYGISRWGALLIAREVGVLPTNRQSRSDSALARSLEHYRSRPVGQVVAAYAAQVAPVTYVLGTGGSRSAPRTFRAADGARVRVYMPSTASKPSPASLRRYYTTHVLERSVALVALPDGDGLAFDPSPMSASIVVPELSEHRGALRERATPFRWQP